MCKLTTFSTLLFVRLINFAQDVGRAPLVIRELVPSPPQQPRQPRDVQCNPPRFVRRENIRLPCFGIVVARIDEHEHLPLSVADDVAPPLKLNLVAVPGPRLLAAVPLLAVVGLSKLQSQRPARRDRPEYASFGGHYLR
jgi:hypothetical protein